MKHTKAKKTKSKRSILDKIKEQGARLDREREKLNRLQDKYLNEFYPALYGKKVVVNEPSHNGKEMVVDNIFMRESSKNNYEVVMEGRVVLKDDRISKATARRINKAQ